jgi:hypothetical protein
MILGMSLALFTQIHVALSLIGLGSGFLVAFGMLRSRTFPFATAVFLLTTELTSITGFLFPFKGITPGIVFGFLSFFALLVAVFARYGGHMQGPWRKAWIISSMLAQYLNFFVFIVQSFDKAPTLHAMGDMQKETAFAAAQLTALIAMLLFTILALRRFHPAVEAA